MGDFTDKVVVITGGNSGIGEAIARKFNDEGAKIVIFGRDKHKLDSLCKQFQSAISVSGDVRKVADIEKIFLETEKAFGKVDILIACAGIATRKIVDEVDEKLFDEMVDTNYKGVFFTIQRSIPSLKTGSSIVLISSSACHKGWRNHSVYSSTKAAVSMLARNFAADLIERGVRVNAISPGFTDTPIFDSTKSNAPHQITEYLKSIPVKRFAEPSEIADAVLFLASPKASYIVGVDLVVDGGASSIHPL